MFVGSSYKDLGRNCWEPSNMMVLVVEGMVSGATVCHDGRQSRVLAAVGSLT